MLVHSLLLLLGTLLVLVSSQGPVAIAAKRTGWYNNLGNNDPSNTNYICGWYRDWEYRNFLVFDLSTVQLDIHSARLELLNPSASSVQSCVITFRSVSTSISDLLRGGQQPAVYAALGQGTPYAEAAASRDSPFSIALNSAGVEALNAVRGRGMIAFGGTLSTTMSNGHMFGATSGGVQLLLNAPGPSPSRTGSRSRTPSRTPPSSRSSSPSETQSLSPSRTATTSASQSGSASVTRSPMGKVLIVASAYAEHNKDVQSKLRDTGRFSAVDYFTLQALPPDLALLQQYNAVLVYTGNYIFNDVTFSARLVSFVNGGGKVLVMVWANTNELPVGPSWTAAYQVIPQSNYADGRQTLGSVPQPDNPIMRGVRTFDGGYSWRANSTVVERNGTVVARWSDGTVLAAQRFFGGTCRVDLNFFPVSNAAREHGWVNTTDGAILMANALEYIMANCPTPPSPSHTPSRSPISRSRTPSVSPTPVVGEGTVVFGAAARNARAWFSFDEEHACRAFASLVVRETDCDLEAFACAGRNAPFRVRFESECALPVPMLRAVTAFHQMIVGDVNTEAACRSTDTLGALCFDSDSHKVVMRHDSVDACLFDYENVVVLHAAVGQYCRTLQTVIVTKSHQPVDTAVVKSVTDLQFYNLTTVLS